MDAELTNKSRDAIGAANDRAVSDGHPDITPAHLLLALLTGEDNENIQDLIAGVEADQAALRSGAERLLAALPTVQGQTVSRPQADRDLLAVIADAAQRAKDLGDSFVSTEHLLIALAAKGGAPPASCSRSRAPTTGSCWTPSARSAAAGGSPTRTPRAPTRPWRSSAPT